MKGWERELSIAIRLYVAWQIGGQLYPDDQWKRVIAHRYEMRGDQYLNDFILRVRRVMRSTMGNDTFILNGK